MKTIIAGSRNIDSLDIVFQAVNQSKFLISTVVSGGARGVDQLGEQWAKMNNIPVDIYLANWDKYGKSAGYKRNTIMAMNADALIAIWDGESKGTKHMIDLAEKYGLKTFVLRT